MRRGKEKKKLVNIIIPTSFIEIIRIEFSSVGAVIAEKNFTKEWMILQGMTNKKSPGSVGPED